MNHVHTTIARITRSKNNLLFLAILFMSGLTRCTASPYYHANQSAKKYPGTVVQVCFSPKGNCTQMVQNTIARAKKTILVQAYFFTASNIADALIEAHQRGIDVRILVDSSQPSYRHTKIHRMAQQGIPIAIDKTPGIAHNKVMIIDDRYVLTGSFNWTHAAEHRNTENLLLIQGKSINQAYKTVWYQRAANARKMSTTIPGND